MQNSEKGLHPMAKQMSGQLCVEPGWRWVTERGLRLASGSSTLARYHALLAGKFGEIEDIIPADGSILVVVRRGAAVSDALRQALAASVASEPAPRGALHEIPVVYGGAAGPDLAELAERAGLDAATFIRRHAEAEYTVAFLGFQPGFPYLRGLPPSLQAPRRPSPRVRVAAGSVGIGGPYTGIYPAHGPGGWNLIGRTPAVLFDPQREAPALLMPGDRVRFVPQ